MILSKATYKYLYVELLNSVACITFAKSRLFDERTVRELHEEIMTLVSTNTDWDLLIDFSGVRLMSSTFLSRLILLLRFVTERDKKLRLCGMGPVIRQVFRTSNVDRLFTILQDRPAGLQSMLWEASINCPADFCDSITLIPEISKSGRMHYTCPGCEANYVLSAKHTYDTGGQSRRVVSIALQTYEDERVDFHLGSAPTAALHGRLDVFSAQVVLRAYNVVRSPRSAIFDLRDLHDVSAKGVEHVRGHFFYQAELKKKKEHSRLILDRAAMLVNEERLGQFAPLPPALDVFTKMADARSFVRQGEDRHATTLLANIRTVR